MARHYAESDSRGKHPFQDDGVDLPVQAENASPHTPEYVPQGYEENQAPRGGLILVLAVLGALVAVGMGVMNVLYFASMAPFLILLACTTSLPAFFLGRTDLKAMRAGVMRTRGRGLTLVGTWLGALVSLVSIVLGLQQLLGLLWMVMRS